MAFEVFYIVKMKMKKKETGKTSKSINPLQLIAKV